MKVTEPTKNTDGSPLLDLTHIVVVVRPLGKAESERAFARAASDPKGGGEHYFDLDHLRGMYQTEVFAINANDACSPPFSLPISFGYAPNTPEVVELP
jgi:hypothetical protein